MRDIATVVCGGSAFLLIGMVMRAGYRRLSRLTIPRNGDDLELDSSAEPNSEKADLGEGLEWIFLGETKRQRLTLPRELVGRCNSAPGSSSWRVQAGDKSLGRSRAYLFWRPQRRRCTIDCPFC